MIKQVFQFSFGPAFRHSLEVWRLHWPTLFILVCFFEGLGWLTLRTLSGTQIYQQIFQFLWSLGTESVFILVIPKMYKDHLEGKSPTPFWPHLKKHVEPFTIESLRALGRVTVGLVLLIIPGLIRAIQYYFVAYIVQFDPRYDQGEIDALNASKAMVKGRTFKVFLILLFVTAISLLGQLRDVMQLSPLEVGMAFLLSLFLRVYTQVVLYYLYQLLHEPRS